MIKNCSICNGTGKIELPNDFSKPCDCVSREQNTYIPFDEYYKTYVIKRDWLKQNIFNVDNSTY